MLYPVKRVKLPADLKDQKNGKIDPRLLRELRIGGRLHHQAAQAWEAMSIAARKEGFKLTHVGAYRTYERQLAMFQERYQKKPSTSIVVRTWRNAKWYLKKGKAPCAVPGTSNHGWGLAIDVAGANGALLLWLRLNAGRFGFTWEVADTANPNFEPWHLRYVLGDTTPKAVKLVTK